MYDLQIAASLPITDSLDASLSRISEAGFPAFEIAEDFPLDEAGLSTIRALCYRHQIAPLSALRRVFTSTGERVSQDSLRADADALDSLCAEYLLLASPFDASAPLNEEDSLLDFAIYCEETGLKCSRIVFPGFPSESEFSSGRTLFPRDIRLAFDFTREDASPSILRRFFHDAESRCDYLRLPLRLTESSAAMNALEEALEEADFTGWAVFVGAEGDESPEKLAAAFHALRDRFRL